MTRALLTVGVPAALALGATFLSWRSLQAPVPEAVAPAAEAPRYAVTGAQWLRLGPGGQPEFRASAASIDYFADGSAKLRTIRLDALGGYDSPWRIEAPAGEAPPNTRKLQLTGGVHGQGQHSSGTPINFTTERLWVDLLRRELHTEARVTLQTEARSATARGLRADFDGERVQLLNDVQVDYAPEG
ncbi:MAG TPA: LPS export ABC transporter periplasmic protein LptC [Verrucomicrobiae bacterium]|nr:LPS export ABC transporter periplasmic protein LptC [Verrucomicrobiae bacterium]